MLRTLAVAACVALCANTSRAAEMPGTEISTGQAITPTAARGAVFQELDPKREAAPDLRAGQAAAVAVSPDGRTLAILTSGFNLYRGSDGKPIPELSTEYVFVFDISSPQPKQLQALPLPNTFVGLTWAPSSNAFFASGGSDDRVLEFVKSGSTFTAARTFRLGHKACVGLEVVDSSSWLASLYSCKPMVAGLAVSPDGTRLLVANLQNDSVSLLDLSSGQVVAERDLRPGILDPKRHGQPGGTYPRSVAWISPHRAFVASERDREIISLAVSGTKIQVGRRMPVRGQPVALLTNRKGSRLYAALDTTNEVAIFETAHGDLIESIDATAPQSLYANTKKLGGANSNALALTPDESTLLVSNGGQNAVAVVRLSDRARGLVADRRKEDRDRDDDDDDDDDDDEPTQVDHSTVIGLVPTGRYPTGVVTSNDGTTWYVVNYKRETAGSNARWCQQSKSNDKTCFPENWAAQHYDDDARAMIRAQNQWAWQREKAGFLAFPSPTPVELARLTTQVARNNHFDGLKNPEAEEQLFSFLRAHIKHVIYIIKENKTYDEVLGDLEVGNGDPRLTFFPESLTPNHHALARNYVALDNFLASGEVSWTGWDWSVSAQTNDFREHQEALAMGSRGLYEETGFNRHINMGYATSQQRRAEDALSPSDPDILPGTYDVAAPDGPGGDKDAGHIWDAALRQGRTLRNWGFFSDDRDNRSPGSIPVVRDPYAKKVKVFSATKASLLPYSDPYYRGFAPVLPDYWRVQEWKREFAEFSAAGSAPNLMLVRLGNDHTGDFAHAVDGVNTVDTQVADNDYAFGLLVETVANSPFASDTLIISIEDDPGAGLDHVDTQRSVVLFAGPYVRQHALVSRRYTTVSVVKTIEAILGLEPMGLNDALAAPMSDVFDPAVTNWSYKAIVPPVLRTTQLPLPPATEACNAVPRRSSEYWAKVMSGQDFSGADRIDAPAFSHALWRGLKGNQPYPAVANGADLRANRAQLLTKIQRNDSCRAKLVTLSRDDSTR